MEMTDHPPDPSSEISPSQETETSLNDTSADADDSPLLSSYSPPSDGDNPQTVDHQQAPSSVDASPLSNSVLTSSLAFSKSTPCLMKILMPLLCIGCHALFYYGQTAPMWKLRTYAEIDVWANATDLIAKQTFKTAGLDYDQSFHFSEDQDVQTFTYYFAIEHLWKAKDLPGKTLPRLAAVLLIIFSGVWPHLKLFLLNLTWIFGKHPSRTTTLSWLSTLGKWSLADVLVVCVMVGVLHLDWIVEPDDIKAGLINDLPAILSIVQSQYSNAQLCDKFLKMNCAAQKRVVNKVKCAACQALVNTAYSKPEWAKDTGAKVLDGVHTSGGGLATLRVVGMRGIYAFCGAVILSILLSFVIDVYDHKATKQAQKELVLGSQRREQRNRQRGEDDDPLQEPLLSNDTLDSPAATSPLEVDLGDYESYNSSSTRRTTLFSFLFLLLTWATAIFTFVGIDYSTMERQVKGAGPMLLHDILGVNWERDYSLRSLMWTTGSAGDWDYLLMATFGLFIVLGPAIRAALLVAVTLLDQCNLPVSGLATMVNFIGAFCSWEVFAIAIVMVQMLMPSITNTIINNPVCGKISADGSCLQVEFNILNDSFAAIVVGWCLLVITSWVVVKRGSDRVLNVGAAFTGSYPAVEGGNQHDYQLIGERTSGALDDSELQELVFETNQV